MNLIKLRHDIVLLLLMKFHRIKERGLNLSFIRWSNGLLCFEFLNNNIPKVPNVDPRQIPDGEGLKRPLSSSAKPDFVKTGTLYKEAMGSN